MLNIFEDEMFLSLPLENNGNRAKEVSFISCATKNKRGEVKEARKKFYFNSFYLYLQTNYWIAQKNSLSFFWTIKMWSRLKSKAPIFFSLKVFFSSQNTGKFSSMAKCWTGKVSGRYSVLTL